MHYDVLTYFALVPLQYIINIKVSTTALLYRLFSPLLHNLIQIFNPIQFVHFHKICPTKGLKPLLVIFKSITVQRSKCVCSLSCNTHKNMKLMNNENTIFKDVCCFQNKNYNISKILLKIMAAFGISSCRQVANTYLNRYFYTF